jgi:MSHA biogenesis protein MshJ
VKQLWQRYVQKVDSISLRERVMVFAALAALLIFVLDAALISPQLAKQKRLSREVAQRQGEIKKMQEQLQQAALARQANPDQAKRSQLEELRRRIAETEARLAEEQRKFVPPEQVGALLDQMLSRNKRLQLVDMRTLPVANLADPAPAAAEAAKPAAAGAKPAAAEKSVAAKTAAKPPSAGSQIYRHGVEITLSGNYLDLLAYLRDLEKLPTQLYWGKVDLSVTAPPQVTLKLSVYTLSLDLSWLVV